MNTTTPSKSSAFVSIRWLLLIGFTAIITVVLAGIFYWFYQFATEQALRQVKTDLTQTLKTTSLQINADDLLALAKEGKPNAAGLAWQDAKNSSPAMQIALQKFGAPNKNGFSDDPRYQKLLDWLDTVHQIEPRAWLYLWVNDPSNGDTIYVVDLSARYQPQRAILFLQRKHDPPTTGLTFSTDVNGNFTSYTDDWGHWYGAWAPIFDKNGKNVAGVGADFTAAEVDQMQQALRNTVLIVFAITYVVMFLAIVWISNMITGPILALTRAAHAVGEGNYEQDFTWLFTGKFFHNEVGVLAHVFDIMVEKVQDRVQKLEDQVVKLKIEIDQNKRKNEVEEITNSDFFRDLQARAAAVRKQRNSRD